MRFRDAFLLAAGLLNTSISQIKAPDNTAKRALRTCTRIQNTPGVNIVQLSSGPEYLASAENAWSLYNTVDRPACIVFPRNASHVQVAMAVIFRDKIRYAVQSGGHSAMAGWNTYGHAFHSF
jgi:FAD/FMN-containing dehydrogenase